MKVIFDKNMESEFEIYGQDYYENISDTGMSMTILFRCNPDSGEPIPDYAGLYGREFTTAQAQTDLGVHIAIQGSYSKISSVNIAYNDMQKIYSVNVMAQ